MELIINEYGAHIYPQNDAIGYINSACNDFSYKFYSGIYFLTGEIDCGAWSFAYSLLNEATIGGILYKNITLNGEAVDLEEIKKLSFHVGQFKIYKKRIFDDVLRKALEKSKSDYTVEELIEKFELDRSYLDLEMRVLNMRRWGCSSAIGLALNKKIFVFPWLSKYYFLSDVFFKVFRALSQEDVIVLVPCSEKIQIPAEEKFNVVRMNDLFKFDFEKIER